MIGLAELPPGYLWSPGLFSEKRVLLEFLRCTYEELSPQGFSARWGRQTIDQYFSAQTPRWWIGREGGMADPVAGLWLGSALDGGVGDRYAQVLLLYVRPEHRRRGLARALMQEAQGWAQERGDHQIGLQVFAQNQPALSLYQKLGYQTHALLMVKPF